MKIVVAWQWQASLNEMPIEVADGATVADVLLQLKSTSQLSLLNALESRAGIGVWGKVLSANDEAKTVLRDNDRIELYRPLKADPKLARRQRVSRAAAKQRAR
jgi:putative ubiquitin-RnfH superfamily antitoxin RatB of RatAB toxin-antitoxin module